MNIIVIFNKKKKKEKEKDKLIVWEGGEGKKWNGMD